MDVKGIESDEELLGLCIDGNERAWACLVHRFSGLVCKAIRYKANKHVFCINQNDLDEISQQTFAHIWCNNALHKIDNPRSIPAYITIIAQNITADFLRKRRRGSLDRTADTGYQNHSIESNSPREEAHNRQLSGTIDNLIEELTLKEKRVITLDLKYDLKHREIALIMDMPVNTVSTIIFRIKKLLRQKLEERGYDLKEWR